MQKSLFAAALAAGVWFSGPATAADVYGSAKDVPVYAVAPNWTGFYGGINAGYGASANSDQLVYIYYDPGLTPEGGFAGGQIGYNWQTGPHFVFGVETDLQVAGISDRAIVNYDSYSFTTESRLNWFGTVRGRLGYAAGDALFYVTGGFAYGGLHKQYVYTDDETYEGNKTATGYVAGAGIEYRWSPAWSIKAEYQYINLGQMNFCDVSAPSSCWRSGESPLETDEFHTVRIGLNYHVNADYVPMK